MMLWPCWKSPSGASPRRKLHTASSIGFHTFGNSAQVVAATTTAVGVGSTAFTATSTAIVWTIAPSRSPVAPSCLPPRDERAPAHAARRSHCPAGGPAARRGGGPPSGRAGCELKWYHILYQSVEECPWRSLQARLGRTCSISSSR